MAIIESALAAEAVKFVVMGLVQWLKQRGASPEQIDEMLDEAMRVKDTIDLDEIPDFKV